MAATAVVLAFFAVDTWQNAPETFGAMSPSCARGARGRALEALPAVAGDPGGDVSADVVGVGRVAGRRPRGIGSGADADAVEFLLRFARAAHDAGYPTADLEERVVALGDELGIADVQISSTPTVVDLSLGRTRISARTRSACGRRPSTWTRSPGSTTWSARCSTTAWSGPMLWRRSTM